MADASLDAFISACRHAAGMARPGCRAAQRAGGAAIVAKAKSNAGQHSTTIPPSIRYRSREGAVSITAGTHVPLAALYELGNASGGRPGSFRHPVFGDKNVWEVQTGYPFLKPALEEMAPSIVKSVEALAERMAEVLAHGR